MIDLGGCVNDCAAAEKERDMIEADGWLKILIIIGVAIYWLDGRRTSRR